MYLVMCLLGFVKKKDEGNHCILFSMPKYINMMEDMAGGSRFNRLYIVNRAENMFGLLTLLLKHHKSLYMAITSDFFYKSISTFYVLGLGKMIHDLVSSLFFWALCVRKV